MPTEVPTPPTARDVRAIKKRAEQNTDPHAIYKALHRVGDDPIKSCIEDACKALLPPDAYKILVGILIYATEDDL